MIQKVTAKKFTVFRDEIFSFAKGINVIIGSNGAGKSHVLKLAYTAARWSQEMGLREKGQSHSRLDKATLQKELARKLTSVFLCEGVGRLSTRGIGVQRTEVEVSFYKQPKANMAFSFSTRSTTDVILDKALVQFWPGEVVFFPTKEVLTMFSGFASLYRERSLQVDETYYDLCLALEKPMPRGPKLGEIRPLLDSMEDVLHGSIKIENGRFYLSQPKGGYFEIPLVAEGFRKLGTVAYLLANGTLGSQSVLFWDEPETNLNPAYMVKLAELLLAISRTGTQIILATHSLFLMRELSLQLALARNKDVDRKFFALETSTKDISSVITEGTSAEDIEPITALDAEIEQSQRYMETTVLEGTQ